MWKSKSNRLEVRTWAIGNGPQAYLLPQLYDKSEHRIVAESGSQELSLTVHEPALALLEHVVFTFLVIQKQRRSPFKMSWSFTSHSTSNSS